MTSSKSILDILFSPYDYDFAKQWMDARQGVFYGIITAYIVALFGAKFYFKLRSPMALKGPLALWNVLLAVFSLAGFLRVAPLLLVCIQQNGLVYSYTQIEMLQTDNVAGYWTLLWVLSKVPELADSFFIVARKRPIRFMHWFHHAMSILFGTINFTGDNAYLVWVVCMNFLIHAVMYSYYFVASLGVRLPRLVAQTITTAQMIQFIIIIGQLAHIAILQQLLHVNCAISLGGFSIGLFTTTIYLNLWTKFYQEQYLRPKEGKKIEKLKKPIILKR